MKKEFLSPGGIRSISKVHEKPYAVTIGGQQFGLIYQPAESDSNMFGGNSNWRGPVWMPMNYLLVIALQQLYEYHKEDLKIEFPSGSGNKLTLSEITNELTKRLISIFKKDENGNRPVHDNHYVYRNDPNFNNLILFYEYFHGDSAKGLGASHQTGWTGVIAELINR